MSVTPQSLVWATELDVLPADRMLERRHDYLVVRSPANPTHYWGNLLLFDDPPAAGDGRRWEHAFEAEFGGDPRVQHRTFAWDRVEGALGAAREEFTGRGYEVEQSVGLIATAAQLRAHPRASRDVAVHPLSPLPGADDSLWSQVIALQVAGRDRSFEEAAYRAFITRRLRDLRELFYAGRGSWYVALGEDGKVLGSCGVVVTGERGRFQTVDTAARARRRGICSRLLVEAAHRTAERYDADRFVIVADPNYHALGLYESLGFRRRELVAGVYRQPRGLQRRERVAAVNRQPRG
ncbi:MAG: GNAT family N-acetyltransferase [Solirubrobacteraceae bacterium]